MNKLLTEHCLRSRAWTNDDQFEAEIAMFEGGTALRDHRAAHRKSVRIAPFNELVRGHNAKEREELTSEMERLKSSESEEDNEMGYWIDMEIQHGGPVHELTCPVCGSKDVESDSINDYGGTTSGWTTCGFCSYSTSWADLSAVI